MPVPFFSLPVEVFQGPILSFLSPLCLSQLDCAVANRCLRKDLLDYFKHAVTRNKQDEHTFPLDPRSLQWIISRKLIFSSISVVENDMSAYSEELSFVAARAARVECGSGSLCGESVVKMLQSCQNLQSLTLNDNSSITDSVLSAITAQHSTLKALNISSCKTLTDHSQLAIARSCSALQRLDIGNNPQVHGYSIARMLCQLPNLRWLDVNNADFKAPDWTMIFDHCPLLEHIDISFTNFTAATMTYMGLKCPLITSVAMRDKGNDSKVAALARALPNLQELYLEDSEKVKSAGVVELARCCKNLRKLELSHTSGVTNESLIALAQNCPHLTYLDCVFAGGHKATDVGIIQLVQGCTELETLLLPYCNEISDVSVVALAQNCPRLQKLHALCGRRITDAGMIALSTHCPPLRHLTLCFSKIKDAALFSFATHLPGLKEVCFHNCDAITSTGVAALAQRCVGLTSVRILQCFRVGDAGVIPLVQNCRRLRFLEFSEMPGVTNAFADVVISLNMRTEMFLMKTGITADKLALLKQSLRKVYR